MLQEANKVNDTSCNIFLHRLDFEVCILCILIHHSDVNAITHNCIIDFMLTIKYLPDLVNLLILNCSLQLLRIYNKDPVMLCQIQFRISKKPNIFQIWSQNRCLRPPPQSQTSVNIILANFGLFFPIVCFSRFPNALF